MSEDLIKALLGEPEKKEFDFGGKKVVFRTLTQKEMDEVMKDIPRTDLAMFELEKVPILARSLVSVNGVSISAFSEVQDAINENEKVNVTAVIEKILSKMDTSTVNALYSLYGELLQEVTTKKNQLKNASRVQSEGPSIESAKSSK